MKLNLSEIITITNSELKQPNAEHIEVTGVSTDSRTISKGNLFVPLIGDQFDGHSFIELAEANGAVAALWQKDRPVPDNVEIPLIEVEDTLIGLQELSQYYRQKINPIIIGVTGSNGKTTTKDLLSSVLSPKYKVHKTKGNLNNHIGVPLTLLSMPDDTEVAVVEMGMSSLGEIELLSSIAKPDIAVITNIGESHIEFLKTRENIAKAKLEITKGLKGNGWLILPGDEQLLRNAEQLKNQEYNIIWIGHETKNDIYPTRIELNDFNNISFSDNLGERYALSLFGNHNVINALLAIEVGKLLKVSLDDIKQGLLNIQLTGMRLEKMVAKNGSTILNDAYNASPTSMKAALDILASRTDGSRKIALLGDMLELGEQTKEYHEEVGSKCASLGIDILITTGKFGSMIVDGAKAQGMASENIYNIEAVDDIPELLLRLSDSNTVILVKASRGVHLERVINKLV